MGDVAFAAESFSVANDELGVLQDIRRRCCREPTSAIVATWCIGETQPHENCGAGVVTHPCTGRVLSNPLNSDPFVLENASFHAPWWGVVCDATTTPVAIVELVLPYQGLACSLDSINFTALSNLEVLNLEGNEFTGPLPEWIGTMSSLEVLNLNGNRLHGPLLDSIIDNVNLVELSLAQNELTGLVPNQLKVLPLEVLDLFGNQFSGPLPPDVLRNPRLRYLDLSENALSGPFPPHMLLPRLAHFDVSFNELTGPLPPNMHLFGRDDTVPPSPSQLEYFDASNNRLESAIPGLIGQLERLAVFSVRNNSNIFGKVPPLPPLLLQKLDPTAFDGSTHHLACPLPDLGPSRTWGAVVCSCKGNKTDAGACMACPSGFVLDATLNTCSGCPLGSFPQKDICEPCPSGTFAATLGSPACQTCPDGYTSLSGASICNPCPPGTSTSDEGTCLACPPGLHAPAPGTTCLPCPNNTFSAASGTIHCIPCPHNAVADEGSTQCFPCPQDTTVDLGGSRGCVAQPRPGTGYFGANDDVADCIPGTFNDGTFARCQPCSRGSFSSGSAATNCTLCSTGSFTNTTGASQCVYSPPGTYTSTLGATEPTFCAPGSISDVAGATQCSHCPKHTMAPRLGSSACMLAPPGSVLKTTAWPSFLLTLSQPQQFRLDDLNMSKITEIVHHAWLFVSPEPMSSLVVSTFDNKLANNQQFGGTSSVSLHVVLDTHATTLELLQHIPAYLVVLDMLLDEAAMLLVTDDAPTRLDVLQPLQLPVAVPCGKGTFSNGTHCVDCGVGTFNDRLGATKCHKCHRGSRASISGSHKCTPCGRDEFADATATKCMECPTFSIDLSLVCPQANGRFIWLVFYILYYLHFVWTSHLYLYGQPTRAPPLMASYRANGGQTVNTAIVWPPPIVISAATLRSKRGI
ncbi:hypothetical protein H310_04379 [Aphanomyces invadans]|uniref:Tyrosine-protein kinase ephrin type A/B receptor-like domain-containing protein n=1 Tax=Aphanomyces invadans TaxID=157072 RepID=A0A024UC46_9STRA|nr:hypothetical protein H310_04379 [Aphanomyces invadans]ETW03971.1 hypothetical protein H310_04379 [Aphanomyces invadans]|eukprot:XP_008866927.1 hypothetical protein H310_04379 [Aphanomyces invadans]